MAVKYEIEDLLGFVNEIRYFPEVGAAVNNALSAKSPVEYEAAIEQATSLAYSHAQFSRGYKSEFGLPLFMPFEFDPFAEGETGLLLPSSVVDVKRTKLIVSTDLQGRDSSVTEFVNNGDFQISVSGIIATRGHGYPLDAVEEFNKYMELKQSLRIIHELLNALGVYDIVITDYDLPKTPYHNCQFYSFNARSQKPIELTINE